MRKVVFLLSGVSLAGIGLSTPHEDIRGWCLVLVCVCFFLYAISEYLDNAAEEE